MKIIGPIQDHYSTNGKHLAFMTYVVNFNSMVFMFKVYANLLPSNLLSFFKSEW